MVMILYKGGEVLIMKKYAYLATFIIGTASAYSHFICSRFFFNQPRTPKQ